MEVPAEESAWQQFTGGRISIEDYLRSTGSTVITTGEEFKASLQRTWEKIRAERRAREDAELLPTAHLRKPLTYPPTSSKAQVIVLPGEKLTVGELRTRFAALLPDKPQLAEQIVQSIVRAANMPPKAQ